MLLIHRVWTLDSFTEFDETFHILVIQRTFQMLLT